MLHPDHIIHENVYIHVKIIIESFFVLKTVLLSTFAWYMTYKYHF